MTRVKPCAKCHHLKSLHRAHECRHTWQTRGKTFMGIRTVTKWCTCDGYQPIPKEVLNADIAAITQRRARQDRKQPDKDQS